jgi:hypothetical protein
MEAPRTENDRKEPQEDTGTARLGAAGRWLVRAFPFHVCGFLAGNALLGIVNLLTGGPWWAFWPLLATAGVLAVHFLLYKSTAVDERWVEERVEEVNLKSYDRSHIEDLRTRHGENAAPGQDRA